MGNPLLGWSPNSIFIVKGDGGEDIIIQDENRPIVKCVLRASLSHCLFLSFPVCCGRG
jgi:hypothetical protein